MENPNKEMTELVTASNIVELTKQVVDKVGLEYLAPLPESEMDELISATVLKYARS